MNLKYIFLFICLAQMSVAQEKWVNYSNNFSVTDVIEKGDDLWLSSHGGLCFYEASSNTETYYNRANSDLPSNAVNDLLYTTNEDLWITTNLGICKFSNGEFELGPVKLRGLLRKTIDDKIIVANNDSLFIQKEGMDFEGIRYPATVAGIGGIEIDQETGAIYFNAVNYFADSYVAVYKDDAWTMLYTSFSYETAITLDNQNQLWLLESSTLSKFENGVWNVELELLNVDQFTPSRIDVLKNDDIIIIENLHRCQKIRQWDGNALSELEFVKDECQDCHFIKASENQDDLYFATNRRNGFYSFSKNEINDYQPFSQSPIHNNNPLNTLHTKDNRHILIFADKIQVLKSGDWSDHELPDDLSENLVAGHLAPNDVLWIHDDNSLWSFQNNNWTKLPLPSQINSKISLMEIGPDGEIWIQSSLNIARYMDDIWRVFNTGNHQISSSIIKDLQVDPSNGKLWVTTFQGVRSYDGENWSTNNLEPVNQVFKSAVANNGLYVRYAYGFAFIHDDIIDTIPLPTEGYYGPFESNLIYDENEEALYLTGTNHLAILKNNEWTTYSTLNSGIYNGASRDVSIDQKGNVWLSGSNGGLSVYNEEGVILSFLESNNNRTELKVNLFPNILRSENLSIEVEQSGTYEIIITDIKGTMLEKFDLQLNANHVKQIQLPTEFPSIGFITISNKQSWVTKKVIKVQ